MGDWATEATLVQRPWGSRGPELGGQRGGSRVGESRVGGNELRKRTGAQSRGSWVIKITGSYSEMGSHLVLSWQVLCPDFCRPRSTLDAVA